MSDIKKNILEGFLETIAKCIEEDIVDVNKKVVINALTKHINTLEALRSRVSKEWTKELTGKTDRR